jgi:hypothetical protein
MDCSDSKISTVSKVRLFVLQAAKVLGTVLIFEEIFHSIIFQDAGVFPSPPTPPPNIACAQYF